MNKTAETEFHRSYLIDGLPEPLTPASSHLQLYDRHIENTRIRLRSIRDPYSKGWTYILQQKFTIDDRELGVTKVAEIHLNDAEHAAFADLNGSETRKNRYFHEFDRIAFVFDVYLGPLSGLVIAKAAFATREQMQEFIPPPFAVFEVTNDPFFANATLAKRTFVEVEAEVGRVGSGTSRTSIDDD